MVYVFEFSIRLPGLLFAFFDVTSTSSPKLTAAQPVDTSLARRTHSNAMKRLSISRRCRIGKTMKYGSLLDRKRQRDARRKFGNKHLTSTKNQCWS